MKRKLIVLLLATIMCVNGNISVYAGEINNDNGTLIQDNSIPTYMLPNTVIEYVDDDEYKIIQGGEANENYENGSIYEWARQDLLKRENIDLSEVTAEKTDTLLPAKGMVIQYGDDGRIVDINSLYSNSKERASKCPRCGNYFVTGSAGANENYMWGGEYGNNNILYSGNSIIYGYGRFTNFTDSTGQADHKLKKGDVATRGHVDNPKTGTSITCKAPVKGTGKRLKVTMQKWDIGCLPDAVLDIWKTGVENWGYTWSSSVSINDGYYEYSR